MQLKNSLEKYKENWNNIFNNEQFKKKKAARERMKWILPGPCPFSVFYDKEFFQSLLNSREKYNYNWNNIFKK
jgi:hypothetical protein